MALTRPAEERAKGRYSVQWLSGRALVSVSFRRSGRSPLEEPSFGSPFDLGMRRASVKANLYRYSDAARIFQNGNYSSPLF